MEDGDPGHVDLLGDRGKKKKHTAGGILRWSPTLILVARFSAYVWQSGRDAQFSLTYGRMYQINWSRCTCMPSIWYKVTYRRRRRRPSQYGFNIPKVQATLLSSRHLQQPTGRKYESILLLFRSKADHTNDGLTSSLGVSTRLPSSSFVQWPTALAAGRSNDVTVRPICIVSDYVTYHWRRAHLH